MTNEYKDALKRAAADLCVAAARLADRARAAIEDDRADEAVCLFEHSARLLDIAKNFDELADGSEKP